MYDGVEIKARVHEPCVIGAEICSFVGSVRQRNPKAVCFLSKVEKALVKNPGTGSLPPETVPTRGSIWLPYTL